VQAVVLAGWVNRSFVSAQVNGKDMATSSMEVFAYSSKLTSKLPSR